MNLPKRPRETLIDLLRHGEPVGGKRYRGGIDDPLSEGGWQQMWHAASGATPWERILTSPLQRCSAFAETLGQRLGVPVETEARFREIGFGAWEGRTGDELRQEDPGQLRRFYADPVAHRPPGAEPVADFVARVAAGMTAALGRHPGRHLLIVAHAGVIRAAIAQVLEMPPPAIFRIEVQNAALSRLRGPGERPAALLFHGRERL
jgi:alpha-ribazole phosphatase